MYGFIENYFWDLYNDQEGSLDSETLLATSGGLGCYLGLCLYFIKDDMIIWF